MNSPFDHPPPGGAADEPNDTRYARPEPPSSEGLEWSVREVRSPSPSIGNFQRRLFELTPHVLVTRVIVVANLAVFALMAFGTGELFSPDAETLRAWGSNCGPLTLDDQWWRVLTSMFVHVGIIHVGFNMWILWDIGHLVERLVGNIGFLVLYVVSGVFGSVASVYWNPHVNSAGASGAVFGVFGALMGFILLRGDSVPKSILGRLRSSGLTFLAINLAIGFSIRWIDNAAHIGGLAAGFVCGVLMSHPLDRVTGTSRLLRNVSTAAIGAIGTLVALHFAPDAPDDVLARLSDFSTTERSVLDKLGTAWQRWENGRITEDEFAGVVEVDVLPPWREARQELDGLNNVQSNQEHVLLKLRKYVQAREEAWEALLAYLRNPSEERMREYVRKNATADALLKDLNSG